MAKKLSDDDQAAEKSNVTGELLQKHYRFIHLATVAKDLAVSDLRDCRKRAKAAGIDLRAFDAVLTLKKLDEDEAVLHIRHLGFYGKVFGMSFATQPDMFGDDDAPRPSPEAQHEHALFEADDEGRSVGLAGNSETTNPHQVGTDMHQAWHSGWKHGRAAFDERTEADGQSTVKPRGRKAKVGNPEDRPAS